MTHAKTILEKLLSSSKQPNSKQLLPMSYIRPCMQIRSCSTSRCSTNSNPSKQSPVNWGKIASENFLTFVWKSVTVASSVLNPVTQSVFRTSKAGKHLFQSHSRQKSDSNFENESKSTSLSSATESNVLKDGDFIFDKSRRDKEPGSEESFFEWVSGIKLQNSQHKAVEEWKMKDDHLVPQAGLKHRSRFLVQSLSCATSPASQLLRLEEVCRHLLAYPKQRNLMLKEGLLRTVLWLKQNSSDRFILEQLRVALGLLGYHDPPRGNGIRILSIDGGGTRGIMAIEILRQLETRTSKKVYELFDYICGVSSGAILALLLGGLRMSLDECETLYRKLSMEVFSQSPLWGTGSLVWSHAYYDTTIWVGILQKVFKEKLLIDTIRDSHAPKLGAISALMNLSSLRAFVFRNYDFPVQVQSQYLGSCNNKMWEAIRASGAAPGYFQEYSLDDYLHQDGGVLVNNPSALAIHEARLLWPSESIQCVISLGSGRYTPTVKSKLTSTSLKTKVLKIIDSATDTEAVHIALNDLLSSRTYFRFNPYLTEFLYLDENRPKKLQQLQTDAQMYLRRNEFKFSQAIDVLSQSRTSVQRICDWCLLQKMLLL